MHKKIVLLSILFLPMILVGASCTTSTEQTNTGKEQTAASVTPAPAVENSASPSATPSAEGTNSDGVGGGETNTNTSDWLTYENAEYGFTLKYPADYHIEKLANQEIYIKKNNVDSVKILIYDYDELTAENGFDLTFDEYFQKKVSLPLSQKLLDSFKTFMQPNTEIQDLPMYVSANYSVEGADYYLSSHFFIQNNYIRVTSPIEIEHENLSWPEDKEIIEKTIIDINNKNVASSAVQKIDFFNQLIHTFSLQNK